MDFIRGLRRRPMVSRLTKGVNVRFLSPAPSEIWVPDGGVDVGAETGDKRRFGDEAPSEAAVKEAPLEAGGTGFGTRGEVAPSEAGELG